MRRRIVGGRPCKGLISLRYVYRGVWITQFLEGTILRVFKRLRDRVRLTETVIQMTRLGPGPDYRDGLSEAPFLPK